MLCGVIHRSVWKYLLNYRIKFGERKKKSSSRFVAFYCSSQQLNSFERSWNTFLRLWHFQIKSIVNDKCVSHRMTEFRWRVHQDTTSSGYDCILFNGIYWIMRNILRHSSAPNAIDTSDAQKKKTTTARLRSNRMRARLSRISDSLLLRL